MALLLVLVAVMALSLIIAGLWQASQPSWDANTLARAQYRAGLLAESGITMGLHPRVEPGDLALRQEMGPNQSFEVIITSEGGAIPVNSLADEILRDATREMFVLWGLDAAAASLAADSVADWIDGDSDPLPNGAENDYYAALEYPEFPPNATVSNLDELMFVAGMDAVERLQPRWREYFTTQSDGLIDLNAAPREVIAAITGCTPDTAINFVAVRNGDDGIEGTVDDYLFDEVGEVQAVLGLSESDWNEISALVTLAGTVKRIESTGRIGDFEETRIVLARETQSDGTTVLTPIARFRN